MLLVETPLSVAGHVLLPGRNSQRAGGRIAAGSAAAMDADIRGLADQIGRPGANHGEGNAASFRQRNSFDRAEVEIKCIHLIRTDQPRRRARIGNR